MIDQQTIDRVRDTAQILDVVSEFVTLRRRGQSYVGLCPFHNDKTPSFYVSPAKNICKCFSCGKGGDAVRFLMEHEQMGFLDAIRWLAAKYGIEIEERRMSEEELAAQTEREGMLMANELARDTFAAQLFDTPEGRNIGLTYFRERGFGDATIREFQLGYALDARSAFADLAIRRGAKREWLLKTGLVYEREGEGTLIDRFRGRVIFPIHALSGKVVAFGGRVLDARTKGINQKYVNSPESAIYHKSSVLYGIFQAKQSIAKADRCYLVEGYTDVLSMHQAGITNVVASSGTALTPGQVRLIRRFTSNVTVLYDGDAAGIHAALRGIDIILGEGLSVKVLLLPDEEDPDSFARSHTSSEFLDYIAAHETDFLRFKATLLMREAADDPARRADVIADVVRTLAILPDPITTSVYIRDTARILDVGEVVLANAVNVQRAANAAAERKAAETARRRELARSRASIESEAAASPSAEKPSDQTATESPDSPASPPPAANDSPSKESTDTPREKTSDAPDIDPTVRSMFLPKGQGSATAPTRRPQPTDRYERNLIRYLVRDGGKSLLVTGTDEAGQTVTETWRVVDFVGAELAADGITLRHPLYARMYDMAIDASADPQVAFDSARFFSTCADEEVAATATDMLADRYATFGIAEADQNLDVLVPRALLELKDAIVRDEISRLKDSLRRPDADIRTVMTRINELNEVRKLLEKDLGERIITM